MPGSVGGYDDLTQWPESSLLKSVGADSVLLGCAPRLLPVHPSVFRESGHPCGLSSTTGFRACKRLLTVCVDNRATSYETR